MARLIDLMEPAKKPGPAIENRNETPKQPQRATLVRTASQRLKDAENEPPTLRLFGNYVCSSRITLCFADTKVGKTILAMQLTDCITKGVGCLEMENESPAQKALYYDFELMDKDFEDRYKNYAFSDNFLIATLDTSVDVEFTIAQIEEDVDKYGATFVVIDNIMALTANSLSEADAALKLMKQLDRLKKRKKISILVLAHNNKIQPGQPINRNQLAGSKVLQNYIDSLIAIGESTQAGKRYIKHLFTRTGKRIDDVLVCDILEASGCLFFGSMGFDQEGNHVGEVGQPGQPEQAQGASFWQDMFGFEKELSVVELKERLIATGMKEKDAMNKMYRAKELDRPRRGWFSIKEAETKFSNSQILTKPYAFEKSENLRISDQSPFESPFGAPSANSHPNSQFSNSQNPSTSVRIENLRISPAEVFEAEKPGVPSFDLHAIAYKIWDGYDMRNKIGAIKTIMQEYEVNHEKAYGLFMDMLSEGIIAEIGDGDYILKDS